MKDGTCYWPPYSRWKAKFWHLYLVGPVVPFLRIGDFKKEFDTKTRAMIGSMTSI